MFGWGYGGGKFWDTLVSVITKLISGRAFQQNIGLRATQIKITYWKSLLIHFFACLHVYLLLFSQELTVVSLSKNVKITHTHTYSLYMYTNIYAYIPSINVNNYVYGMHSCSVVSNSL